MEDTNQGFSGPARGKEGLEHRGWRGGGREEGGGRLEWDSVIGNSGGEWKEASVLKRRMWETKSLSTAHDSAKVFNKGLLNSSLYFEGCRRGTR